MLRICITLIYLPALFPPYPLPLLFFSARPLVTSGRRPPTMRSGGCPAPTVSFQRLWRFDASAVLSRSQPLELDDALTESEALSKIREIANKNKVWKNERTCCTP